MKKYVHELIDAWNDLDYEAVQAHDEVYREIKKAEGK